MSRRNDNSPYPRDWTTRKLFRELDKTANLEGFYWRINPDYCQPPTHADDIREITRLYRKTWMLPIIIELAKRMKIEL